MPCVTATLYLQISAALAHSPLKLRGSPRAITRATQWIGIEKGWNPGLLMAVSLPWPLLLCYRGTVTFCCLSLMLLCHSVCLFPFVFSRLCIPWKYSPGNRLSSLVIITYNTEWKQAGRRSELPSGRGRIAEPGSGGSEPRIRCECHAISGIYTSSGTQEVSRG